MASPRPPSPAERAGVRVKVIDRHTIRVTDAESGLSLTVTARDVIQWDTPVGPVVFTGGADDEIHVYRLRPGERTFSPRWWELVGCYRVA